MSKFLTHLEVELVDDTEHEGRGSWKLLRPLRYESDVAGATIEVPSGFITDFASVPRLPVTYALAGDTAHGAATIHDFLYSASGPRYSRKIADKVLKEAAFVEGVPGWRVWIIYAGVRLGGAAFYKKDKDENPINPSSGVGADGVQLHDGEV
jgi:hypothetical protein